jgi:HAD superfamily hydrolase (TIGR01509 family)
VKRLRGVVFDYGNTLVRLDPSVRSLRTDYADVVAVPGARRLAAYLGGPCPDLAPDFIDRFLEVRERNRGLAEKACREIGAIESLRETLRELGHACPSEHTLERAIDEYFEVEIGMVRPMPGAGESLGRLRGAGLRLAMLSNATSGRYVAEAVARMGWSGFFDPLVVSADLGVRKPRAEAFRAVLGPWNLDPGAVAMVGDSLFHDVAGAQALGMKTVHFAAIANPFDGALSGSVRPDLTVKTHEELLRALLADFQPGALDPE